MTYGTFAPGPEGDLFPPRDRVRDDFMRMHRAGVNTVRTYTPPPAWLLEEARTAGLRVLAGVFWEGRDCIYDDPRALRAAEAAVRATVRQCRDHRDVVLAYVIGNEVPPVPVRFHGRRPVERFLRRLYDAAKAEDPAGLVTYGNFPSTEFLQLDFLDFFLFNVYLLERGKLSAYLDRLLILAQSKPLLLGEVGDDSRRRGRRRQADLLDWTIPLALDKGVAGMCVFSWTDDWVVGGQPVDDWDFGLVDRARRPKPALAAVARRFHESPDERRGTPWPRVSVVVCNHNGGATLSETLASLEALNYPDFEILLVDDGSVDRSREIARCHPRVRLFAQENRGLSDARNFGARAATGSIVAYTDADAFADPDWLRHLVRTLESGDFAAAGGPNLTPAADGLMAQFIGYCPGNPTYVLKDNVQADHIAGVNMAFRRDALLAIGGFDPVHTRAGDDVDICWRLEDAGLRIAFSPAAVVWHHRRPSIRAYLKQQAGYGEAENQLERKHPERFNLGGYIRWQGRVYTAPRRVSALFRPFIYHGYLGMGSFQSLYQKDPATLAEGPATIQWYLASLALLLLSPLSIWLLVVGLCMLGLSLWVALVSGLTVQSPLNLTRAQECHKVAVIASMVFLHPLVRQYGRWRARWSVIEPRRWLCRRTFSIRPRLREILRLPRRSKEIRRYWNPGLDRPQIVGSFHRNLKGLRAAATLGRPWENFDLIVAGPVSASGRIFTAPEHYGRALCVGLKVYTARWAWTLIPMLIAGAFWLAAGTAWLPLCLALPAALLWCLLGERARLRQQVWSAVKDAMAANGGQRF